MSGQSVEPGEAALSGAREAAPRRLHPVTPLRRAWAPIAVAAGFVVHDLDQAQQWFSELTVGLALLGLAVLIPAAGAYGFLSWWFTRFAVTDTELRIRTGLLFRRTAHIRLDRLQAVDVTQPLLARFLGVAKLKLDVIGTDEKDELAYLSEKEARALRAELLARAAGIAPEAAASVGDAPVRRLVRVDPKTLAVSLLLMTSTWLALVAAVLGPPVVWLLSDSLWAALATALPLLGGVWAASGGRFISEYDWTVGESPDGLRLDHGLLDREHETVPPGRVQTVRIVEPLLWRRRGWVRVELDVAGSAQGVLLPVAERAVAKQVIGRVLPGVDLQAVVAALEPPPARAGRCVPVWWRGHGFAADGEVFAAGRGLLARTVAVVPHAKVQSVRRSDGPWRRRLGLADVHVDTGANKTVTARLRAAGDADEIVASQAERSRTGRREALPERWLTR
ncbi:PH domain-containing protein [Streptomyces sp. KR80]|uniref:PH domain-containing protein n=1 Tax=Streptomyces sp. KR80 TaxID=3457426 RepID=UPI003FD3E448